MAKSKKSDSIKRNTKKINNNKEVDREISNSIYFSGLCIIFLCLITGIYTFYNYETVTKYESSYLVSSKVIKDDNIVNYNNAIEYFGKLNGDYYIYIGYNYDKEVYNLEKKLKTVIKSYNLQDKFYYLNIDKIKNDENVVDEVNAYLGYRDAMVSQVPTIIYVNKNNQVRIENIVARDDGNFMSVGDFQKVLDINEISK